MNDEQNLRELGIALDFDEEQRQSHEKDHTALISAYREYQVGALEKKNKYKLIFFIVCMLLLLFPIGFVVIVYRAIHFGWLPSDSCATAATIVGAMFGFTVDLVVLPKTVAEYFFNKEEDKNIIQLFANARQHDSKKKTREDKKDELFVLRKL